VAADMPAGQIGVRTGNVSAASDRFTITIQGRGGHAARPQVAVDPVVVGAYIVTALQTLVSREVDPVQPAVVTVGSLVAGEAMNVIPDTATLKGTVRTMDPDVRDLLERRLTEVVQGVGAAMRAEVSVDFMRGYPSMVNDEAMCALVRAAAIEVVGEENVVESRLGMGGEDFAYFSLERPGCFFRVGTRNEERGIVWGHHHPRFDVEEEGFLAGIGTMTNSVLRYLGGEG
jgi:amidohydrolase